LYIVNALIYLFPNERYYARLSDTEADNIQQITYKWRNKCRKSWIKVWLVSKSEVNLAINLKKTGW